MSRPLPVHADWLPLHHPDLKDCGVWWDVIRVSERTGKLALDRLAEEGHRSSPAFIDPRGPEPRMYLLVPVGTAAAWNTAGTIALGEGSHVVVPHGDATSGASHHWYRPPQGARLFIDPQHLRAALDGLSTLEAEGAEL
ncbi:hypothetical protein [Streptomyces sp. NPDC059003]|uniref:hypothetical protein n=1 Tax=Streptomyces sp. NPDC059003 TaxID=3346691 RepID=UPI0036B0A94B